MESRWQVVVAVCFTVLASVSSRCRPKQLPVLPDSFTKSHDKHFMPLGILCFCKFTASVGIGPAAFTTSACTYMPSWPLASCHWGRGPGPMAADKHCRHYTEPLEKQLQAAGSHKNTGTQPVIRRRDFAKRTAASKIQTRRGGAHKGREQLIS